MTNKQSAIIEKLKEFCLLSIRFLHNGSILKLISETNNDSLLVERYNKLVKIESELDTLQGEKEENEQKYIRMSRVFYFVVMHKTDCYRAFKVSIDHEGYKSPEGKKLIELARQEIGYSDKTWSGDIYSSIYNTYKSIVVDGVNEPEQIIKDLSGEKIEDVKTVTSTDYPEQTPDLDCGIYEEKESLPYPSPISKHQTDINIGWVRAMKYMESHPVKEKQFKCNCSESFSLPSFCEKCAFKVNYDKFHKARALFESHPVKEITDEEINKKIWEICSEKREWDGKSNIISVPELLFEFAKWMRNKMNL